YLGIGIGAVSTIEQLRWRNALRLTAYVAALRRGAAPPREFEPLGDDVRRRERVLLGLRLDEPLSVEGLETALDRERLVRLERLGLAKRRGGDTGIGETLELTPR